MKEEQKIVKLPRLRKAREAQSLSQDQVAKKARVTYHYVSAAELGDAIPLVKAEKIAKVLGVKVTSLRKAA